MAIITTRHDSGEKTTKYEGRVLEVRTFLDTRNMSDTLDYTDFRTVECTEALVWLGIRHRRYPWEEEKELSFHEQFTWVDVSNHFAWRNGESSKAVVDAVMGVSGDPLMWANLIAWRNHTKNEGLIRQREEEKRAEQIRVASVAKASKAAEKAAKDAAAKAAVESDDLTKVPPKGTEVKVGDFAGKVFWAGTKKYRGKWNVRVGVKNARGEVVWCGPMEMVKA